MNLQSYIKQLRKYGKRAFTIEEILEEFKMPCWGAGNMPPTIAAVIKQYAPIALLMDEFFQKLQKVSKLTPYPATQLEKLLITSSSEAT